VERRAAQGPRGGAQYGRRARRAYIQDASINVTRLAGLHTTIIGTVGNGTDADLEGLSRGDSQIWSELCDKAIVEAQRGDAHIRLALAEHTIAGAVVIGDQAVSYPLQESSTSASTSRRSGRSRGGSGAGRGAHPPPVRGLEGRLCPQGASAAGAGTMRPQATR